MSDNSQEYRTGRHVIYNLSAHIVCVTKYRRGAITERVLELIEDKVAEVCDRWGVELIEINTEEDHLHLLISYPPKVSLARLVSAIKTNTSKAVRETGWPESRTTGKHSFWSPSYFAASTGGASIDTVRNYVQNQRRPNDHRGRKPKKRST